MRQSFNIRLPAGKVWPQYESELTGGGRSIKRFNWLRVHNRGPVPLYFDTKGIPSSNDLSEVWDVVGPGQIVVRNLGAMEDPEGWAQELHILNAGGGVGLALVEISDKPIVDIRESMLADAAGNLAVTLNGASALSSLALTQWGTGVVANALTGADALGNFIGPEIYAQGLLLNNATYDRSRSASAANLAALSGKGVALTAMPGEWAAFANAALGAASSASQAAGGAGIRHIVTGYTIVISSQAAPAAGVVTINIRDGATGAGTILKTITVQIPAVLYAPIVIARSGLSLVGSAATAFTIEQSAGYAALAASIDFEGYDAA